MRTLAGLMLVIGLVAAAPMPASAQSVSEIASEVEANGYYAEPAVSADLADAIDRANGAGTAFVWLDQDGGEEAAAPIAAELWDELDSRNSRYGIVIVLLRDGYVVQAPLGFDQATLQAADLAALDGFSSRNEALGLNDFTSTITAGSSAGAGGGSDSSTTPTTTQTPSGSSSGGFSLGSLLLPLILVGGGFFLFRSWSGRRKAEQAMKSELEADRAEIKEQLRDNADRVIDLGDRVVLAGNAELINDYEQASRAYQDVSHAIDSASTVAEVDELDDKIDHAEWQFEKIEATLEGRPVPPSPTEREATAAEEQARDEAEEAARRKAANDKPALGRDESVISGPRSTRRTTSYPRSSYPSQRRRGGFGGGGLGGILGSIILGQMRRPQTRRTQRRSGSMGGGSLGGGSLGGGVLRRGGSSSRSGSRGSGRSFGGSGRSRGSGRSF